MPAERTKLMNERPSQPRHRMRHRAPILSFLACLLILSGCQFFWQSSLPQLPKGWSWYHDHVYPFDLPVPAGWQAFGYWNEYVTGDHCVREVDLIPATWASTYHYDLERVPEYVSLIVPTTCANRDPQNDQHLTPAGSTTLDNRSASLYTEIDQVGDIRAVVAQFGGHQYLLYFYNQFDAQHNPPPDASQVAIFNTVRENFTYHG